MPPEVPLVSIITPSLNQGEFIERTILSVLKQDYPRIEYIVVDGDSTDETVSVLEKYRSQIALVLRGKDDGQADALTKGFRRASGQILAYMNSDDCYSDDKVISRAVSAFHANPDAEVIYGRRYVVDEKGFFLRSEPYAPFDAARLGKICFIPQECAFWRRQIYEKTGSYIEKSCKFAVDYELWLRFLKAGAKFLALDDLFGLFRVHPKSKTRSIWDEIGYEESRRLQERYTGKSSSAREMNYQYMSHMYRAHKNQTHPLAIFAEQNWRDSDALVKRLFEGRRLDDWVFTRPVESPLGQNKV